MNDNVFGDSFTVAVAAALKNSLMSKARQRTYRRPVPLKYLLLSVENVPEQATVLDVQQVFAAYGRLFSVDLEPDPHNAERHAGHGTVCYQPVPNPYPPFLGM